MRVCVVGLGYVGLVSAAGLSFWGNTVSGVDVDGKRVDMLRRGVPPFFEPDLEAMIAEGVQAGRLSFSEKEASGTADAEIVIVAVGTHDGSGGWQTDTIVNCLQAVVPTMRDNTVLVIRSTLPPEFLAPLARAVRSLRDEVSRPRIPVVLNPEFTREGSAVQDFLDPDRVVIGIIDDPKGIGAAQARRLYDRVAAPVLEMPAIDAALAKLGSNLFLATKISFANELARICDAYQGNIDDVVHVMGLDPRIGGRFLRPGVGFGGSCLPHQVSMMVRSFAARGVDLPLIAAVDEVNARQPNLCIEMLGRSLGKELADCRIALFGLTFKPGTDDLRDAPSLSIAARLIEIGANVVAYDPSARARSGASHQIAGLEIATSALAAADGADAVALVTEWPELVNLEWSDVAKKMRGQVVVDGRNALDARLVRSAGLLYAGFGRPSDDITIAKPRSSSGRMQGTLLDGFQEGPQTSPLRPAFVGSVRNGGSEPTADRSA